MRRLALLIAVVMLIVASATVLGKTHSTSADAIAATLNGAPQVTNAI